MAESDPGSLDRLHDIVSPLPLPWWPPAPGWYVVAALGCVLLAVTSWALLERWRKDRYRREALRELDRLAPTPANLAAIAVLLKRTALAAYERDRVASLTGKDWLAFLDATGGTPAFSGGLGRVLEAAMFERHPPPAGATELAELLAAVRH